MTLLSCLIVIAGFTGGWVAASLLNHLADHLPRMFDLVESNTKKTTGRHLFVPSCPSCAEFIAWTNYLTLKKCQHCQAPRNRRTWITQILFSLCCAAIPFFPFSHLNLWLVYSLLFYFSLIAIIDIEYRYVLRPLVLAGIILGFIAGVSTRGFTTSLIGGLAGFIIMFALHLLGQQFLKIYAKIKKIAIDPGEPALGIGDAEISLINGLLLGWPGIIAGLFLAIFIAGIFSALYILAMHFRQRYQPMAAIPYVPFLIMGTAILLLR